MEVTQLSQLPADAQERLTLVNNKYKISMEQLLSEFNTEYNQDFLKNHPILGTDEKRMIYVSKILKSRYNTRSPLDGYDVIVTNIGQVKTSRRSGNVRGEAYVIVKENTRTKKPVVSGEKCENTINKLYTIVFTGKDVEKLSQIQTGCLYTVPMGVGKSDGTFFADDRSSFENPVSLDVDIIELLKSVGIKECTIAEAINNMAGEIKTSTGTWGNSLDMRIITGMIGDYRKSNDPENPWANYVITDDSVENDIVTADGTYMVKPALTAWLNPIWVVYERNNLVKIVGTLYASAGSKTKPKPKPWEIQMSGSLVVPVLTPYGEIKE